MNATRVVHLFKRVAFGRDYFAREAIRRRLKARESITEAELLRQLQEKVGCCEDFAADFLDLLAYDSLEVPSEKLRLEDRFEVEYSLTSEDIEADETLDSVDIEAGVRQFLGELLFWYLAHNISKELKPEFLAIGERESTTVAQLCQDLYTLSLSHPIELTLRPRVRAKPPKWRLPWHTHSDTNDAG